MIGGWVTHYTMPQGLSPTLSQKYQVGRQTRSIPPNQHGFLSQYILFVRKPIAMTAKDKIALSTFPDVAPLLVLPPLPVQLPYFLLPPQMCHNTGWHSMVFQVSGGQLEITTKT